MYNTMATKQSSNECSALAALNDLSLREKSPRVQHLYDRLQRRMYQPQHTFGSQHSILNETTRLWSTFRRRAEAVMWALTNMPIDIEPDDLIVGNALKDDVVFRCGLPCYFRDDEEGGMGGGHKTPDYRSLLQKGFTGILADIDARLAEMEHEADGQERRELLEAMKTEIKAVIALSRRFAALAEEKARNELDPARKLGLQQIAAVCEHVPEHPARTLHESIQSYYMVHFAFHETNQALSCGLLDRLFAPYLEHDLENGTLTMAQAQELIDCLFLRFNDRAQIDPATFTYDQSDPDWEERKRNGYIKRGEDKVVKVVDDPKGKMYGTGPRVVCVYADLVDAKNHWGNNLLIGGLGRDGKDVTSAATYLFLNAFDKLGLSSPVISVRLHKRAPRALYERVALSLKTGGGMPYINNDDVIISAYEAMGVPYADACEYSNANCWETVLQGTSSQGDVRGINFLRLLECVLTRGRLLNGKGDGWLDTGDPTTFTSFEQVIDAWKRQLRHLLAIAIGQSALKILRYGQSGKHAAFPLLSSLMRDCIDNVACLTHGGARYTLCLVAGEAVANAIDALAVLKTCVFDEKEFTMQEAIDAMTSDFESERGAQLYQRIQSNTNNFGNDIDWVDAIGVDLIDSFNQMVEEYGAPYRPGLFFMPSIATYSWIQSIGRNIGASLDGRKSGETVAANMSPTPGADTAGPVAAINSYLKLDTRCMAAGAPVDLRISTKGLDGEAGINRIYGMLKTFIERKGNMATFTLTSVEELRQAIAQPEKHRNLRVRMGGWSAYFVLLDEETRKIHLKRVEHEL
jgi:choline trimethylamine-lyase